MSFFKYNELNSNISDFYKRNGGTNHTNNDALIAFATLIETRINTNLSLINNPTLASDLGFNIEDLSEELKELISLREKVSVTNKDAHVNSKTL